MTGKRKYMHFWWIAVFLLSLATAMQASTNATLSGELAGGLRHSNGQVFFYLRAWDGNVRPVVITHAIDEYAPSTSAEERRLPAERALVPGTDVEVTAHMDAQSGNWTASRVVVILHHAAHFAHDYGWDGKRLSPVRAESVPTASIGRI